MKVIEKFKHVRFGWKHLLIIFLVLIVFQAFVSQLEQNTLRNLLSETMNWYKQNSAEQIGNLTTTSLELLLESNGFEETGDRTSREKSLLHSLNSILKQPLMNRNVEKICVIFPYQGRFIALDLGRTLYSYFYDHQVSEGSVNPLYRDAVARYVGIHNDMMRSELITSFQEGQNIFHVYVPLAPHGEYAGAVYMKIHPDVASISQQILGSFNNTVLVFSAFILVGLLIIFYVATYTIVERDEAWELLYNERERRMREHITQKREHLFAKRIYHAHHKAEKVVGFINEDLDHMDEINLKETKYRISKYANFIARVIYDMKWYNPPLQTIRSHVFNTNLNEVLRFMVKHIFQRTSQVVRAIQFEFNLDENLPPVHVNEFVVWEIVEPLLQNSIDHSDRDVVTIRISTGYDPAERKSTLMIEDNGKGILRDLLAEDESGVKRIFMEGMSTKEEAEHHGYGCYLAYEIAKRCGWRLDAANVDAGGSRFSLVINN